MLDFMSRRHFIFAAFALMLGAAFFFVADGVRHSARARRARPGFVSTRGSQFVIDGRPFRFVGANAAVIYGDTERAHMTETLSVIAKSKVKVVRVWAFGESASTKDTSASVAPYDWLKLHAFRRGPDDWNEEAFENLDRVIAEASRRHLLVQICLANWWRDTGGVVRYLDWAGIREAADDSKPHGIDVEVAMLFYSNEETRRLYREHLKRIVSRRNSVTGVLYRDDPTIMGYELMNEAQATPGRWGERRGWIAEMSSYLRSLDPDHLITPGTWSYRTSWERREWIADHSLPTIDFCDIHHYPVDDADSVVDSPADLNGFIENRAAAAFAVGKPLVIGEFGIPNEGYRGVSQIDWFRNYFDITARSGVGGAMFWIATPDLDRRYSLTGTERDAGMRAEIARGAQLMEALQDDSPPRRLRDAGRNLIPRQFTFTRQASDREVQPEIKPMDDGSFLYRFVPESAISERFEKIGGGIGYIWGSGVGYLEYRVPPREEWQRVSSIVVRAHLQPVPPHDADGRVETSRITLFINGKNCGARLVSLDKGTQPNVEEWIVDSWSVRFSAMRGKPLSIRFVVEANTDQPYGVNISTWPDGYEPNQAKPVEVEIRK